MELHLGRGINLGNALDAAPRGLALTGRHFDAVAEAGFDSVRLPVRWSAHMEHAAPYRIDPGFLALVDRAVRDALGRGLRVVLDVHHFDELQARPAEQTDRFLAIWEQVAAHYRQLPADRLAFELLNEPRAELTPPRWNALLRRALATVRATSPDRPVIVGPAEMAAVSALPTLELPDDPALLVTVHYYEPFSFTHQGAHWVEDAEAWRGTPWGTPDDSAAVEEELRDAVEWAAARGHRLYVGEFGAYEAAGLADRVRWTRCVRSTLDRLGAEWAYWDFATDFGAWDPAAGAWRTSILEALLPESAPI